MKRKKHPEHVNHERWLVSYADFITLLFAFFVVMYAISQADLAKFKKVSESLQRAFKVSGGPAMIDMKGASGGDTVNAFERTEPAGGRVADLPAGKANTAADPDPELQEVKELLEHSISLDAGTATAADAIHMEYDHRGLIVRLAVKDVFLPGAVEVPEDIRPLIDSIGKVVAGSKRLIRIEGHADRSERGNLGSFPSLWELSAARASWVARFWLKRFPIEPQRLGVAGYGDHRPLGDGRTEADRGRNRRVEIIILGKRSG
ncbi:MAG TPA: flagellar motor protein MotB [Bdellovibrionota bacterium]|nr:flagellar motor protein MotB [Bdellovibrionota bacterium]